MEKVNVVRNYSIGEKLKIYYPLYFKQNQNAKLMRVIILNKSIIIILSIMWLSIVSCTDDLPKDDLPKIPDITATENILTFADTYPLSNSASKNIQIKASNLITDLLIIVISENFEISLDDSNFSNKLFITKDDANAEAFTLYVRFSPNKTAIGDNYGRISLDSFKTKKTIDLRGVGLIDPTYNYLTFNNQHLFFGGSNPWGNQTSVQTFMLHNDVTKIETIKMYVALRCLTADCDPWDQFANIAVRDKSTNEWYEIGRYITPYGVDNSQLDRGFEIDVTDFKSLLVGSTEIKAYIGVWGANGWDLTVDFDYIAGTPDYTYSAVSKVIQYAPNGVPYGVDVDASVFDLTKSVTIPANAESTHLRTIITGWGHATPSDINGRRCAEWCFRTNYIKINGNETFEHRLEPIGCASNPVRPQRGNWSPDRAGWCPGMEVPVRINDFSNPMTGSTFTFEYDYEDWTTDGQNSSANYATSVFVVVKSNSVIAKPTVME